MNSTHQNVDDNIGQDDLLTAKYRDEHDSSKTTKTSLSHDTITIDEELTHILTTKNPYEPKNLVLFYNRDKQFLPFSNVDRFILHYKYEGNLIPIDSDEAKSLLQKDKSYKTRLQPIALLGMYEQVNNTSNIDENRSNKNSESLMKINEDNEQQTNTNEIVEGNDFNEFIDESTTVKQGQSSPSTGKPKKTLNRFNFCEQGIQTYSSPRKDVINQTDPITHKKLVGLVNQRIIYGEYMIDYEKQQKQKDKRAQKMTYGSNKNMLEKPTNKTDRLKLEIIFKRRQVQILKEMERILNQNRYQELIYNFKYFEDKADEVRDPMGTLFPLWKFPPSNPHRSIVTALTWNPAYSDMLIIGYGLYDRAERTQGTIAVFTLNNNHPNTIIHTESTVLSIHCLLAKPYLICVGLMDGDVIVYDISVQSSRAAFANTSYLCKHFGCVWQVRWCTPSKNHEPQFCSIGSDGKVMRWTCIKGELRQITLLDLPSATKATQLDDGTLLSLPDPAIAFDIHRQRKDMFLVGTEHGKIYKASINDPGIIDMKYDAHDFTIYSVQWSPFHPNIFASCSADATIKLWHEKYTEYLMRFDLCTSLRDIAWSPYTSTMFALAGADGKVYIFDIFSNKLEPICEQILTSETAVACTKVVFNPIHPIVLVGDESGWTSCLKLSPNLQKKAKIRKGIDSISTQESEFEKLQQELSRIVTSDVVNDIFTDQRNDIDE